MDAALALEQLVPTAEYFGSLTENTEGAYAALQWHDERPKPTWAELQAAYSPPVPERVTMRQARLALLAAGLLDQVESLLSAMPGAEGQAARIEWAYSSEVWRSKPFVVQLGGALGLTDAQVDALFIAAAAL